MAHLTSWSTLEEAGGATVRGLAAYEQHGVAAGDGGLLLMRDGDDWAAEATTSDVDLLGAAMNAKAHALVVGEHATVLEYRHRLEPTAGDPAGVTSAANASAIDRAQWQIPLDTLSVSDDEPLGVGALVQTAATKGAHPSGLLLEAPQTLERVDLEDIAQGSPPVDGAAHPAWLPGHHADQEAGSGSFSLYLMYDDDHLYAMIETDVDPDALTFIVKGQAGALWDSGDLTLTRHGQDLDDAAHAARDAEATWQQVPEVQALTDAHLHAVAFQDEEKLRVAGSDGTILARESGRWSVTTVDGSKTLRAIDFQGDDGYIAGSDASGTDGGVLYRYKDGKASRVTLPLGSYGLWALDLDGCRAAGSGGSLLACRAGSPTDWQRQTVSGNPALVGVGEDDQGVSWAAGSIAADPAFYRKTPDGSWNAHWLPSDTAEITAFTLTDAGPMIATVTGEILVLRSHAPEFVDIPSTVQGESGEEIEFTIQLSDNDSDVVNLILDPHDALPEPKPTIKQLKKYLFKIIWQPPPDLEGVFEIVAKITDGLNDDERNITIIVDPSNHAPVWDLHPDTTIPHSEGWTTLVQAHDPDGDSLVLTNLAVPAGATFTDLGAGIRELSWTPAAGDLGTHPVAMQADDGEFQVPLAFNVTVVDRRPPTIDHLSPNNARICVAGPWWSGTMTFTASATDPDGGGVNYTWMFPNKEIVRHGPTVSHTFTQLGVFEVVLTVTDDAGVSASRTISIRVVDCVQVEAAIDHDCWGVFEQPTGSVRLWDHTGGPISGTYTLKVWWRGTVGGEKVRTVEGEIIDGVGQWTIPDDLEPLGLNELGGHEVFVTGRNPDGMMGPRSKTISLEYTVSPFCDPKLPLP